MAHANLPVRRYIGGDLVPSVVQANRARFGDEQHEFRVIDLCSDPLPPADLLLCRDALIHFSYFDIWRALANIAASEIAYLATTSYPGSRENWDILTGAAWRHLNLQIEPFNFPPPLMSLPEGFNRPDQVLLVWRVSDLPPSPPASRQDSLPDGES
jgi:hypothetical protein